MLGIENKVAVVTGGTRGLGKAMAQELATFGARVVIAARDEDTGRAAIEELQAVTEHCLFQRADVTKYDDMERLMASTAMQGTVLL